MKHYCRYCIHCIAQGETEAVCEELNIMIKKASSLIACRNTGHKFVGFELSEHYFNLSQERYRQETAQMRLSDFMGG